jgi:TonB family protein
MMKFLKLCIAPLAASVVVISSCSPYEIIKENPSKHQVDKISVLRSNPAVKNGEFLQYYQNTLITKGRYLNDQKTGIWYYYSGPNQIERIGSYTNGVKDGQWTHYYQNGVLASKIYFNQGVIDSTLGYYPNGTLAHHYARANDGSGKGTSYYPNGQVIEKFSTQDNLLHGLCSHYFDNGSLHRELVFRDDGVVSIGNTFDRAGQLISGGTVSHDSVQLISYHFTKDFGSDALPIEQIENYVNGQRSGSYRSLDSAGNLLTSGQYYQGMKVGMWTEYAPNGTIKIRTNYDNVLRDSYSECCEYGLYYGSNVPNMSFIKPQFFGSNTYAQFISSNVTYPPVPRNMGIEGKVIASFIVSTEGEPQNIQIVQSAHPQLDEEVIRLIKSMPHWSPGLNFGVPVRTSFLLPVNFRLN